MGPDPEAVEGEYAARYIESKVRGAHSAASRQPEDARAHGLAASMLTPCIEYLRLGGTPEGIEHALTVVQIAAEDLKSGLHVPDLPDPPA